MNTSASCTQYVIGSHRGHRPMPGIGGLSHLAPAVTA